MSFRSVFRMFHNNSGLRAAGVGFVLTLALLITSMMAPVALARELASMGVEEITALQRRLTDAGCYTGPIDGKASATIAQAQKACPVMDPMLVIETGMHTAPIYRIGVDRECRLLVTGSEDKTVRLWSLPEGHLLRTLQPTVPIFAAVLRVPFAAIAPMIIGSCAVGAYAVQNAMFDIWLMLGFGAFGYVLKKLGYPFAPLTLALVLGSRTEDAFRLSMIGSSGDPTLQLRLDGDEVAEFVGRFERDGTPFEEQDDAGILAEQEGLLQQLASNCLPLAGTLPNDRHRLLALIARARSGAPMLRPEFMRGL